MIARKEPSMMLTKETPVIPVFQPRISVKAIGKAKKSR